ncbi:MAG: ATP-binding protein [Bacillota bacterium]
MSSHILAYLVAIIILITGKSMEKFTLSAAAFLLVGTVFPAALFIMLDYRFLQREFSRRVMLAWNIAKHTVLFAVITLVFAYSHHEHMWLFGSIYLLPVVLSSITLGQRWGTAFAGAAVTATFWLSGGMNLAENRAVGAFEAALVLGGIFFLLAWFLGGIMGLEKETAERMRQERDLIARMMDTSPAGIMVMNRSREIVYANARVEQILGLRFAALQKTLNHVMTGTEASLSGCPEEVFQKVLVLREPVYNYPGTVTNAEGRTAHISISGAPIFSPAGRIEQVVLTVDDVTKQKQMAEEILRADKLESLGLLAGGIAHDFNNFMAVMLGNISLIKMRSRDERIAGNLEHIEKAVLGARELTRKLFIFAKGGAPVRDTVHLRKLLLDTAGFALSGSAVTYETRVNDNLLPVEADEVQIGQVINNILINAVQAMPDGGKIELNAANVTLGYDLKENGLPLPEGEYVRITITDQGTGIPADQLGKIFDPFYSTKPMGSGLGLATAYTIIQSHGGLIRVESKPGDGTTFYIYLPASTNPCPEAREENEELFFGQGRVLVMDDDELVLKACGDMLGYLGYRVSYSRDGAEAVRLYREASAAGSGSAYDIVIMDLTVPGGIGGKEAVELLRQLNPAVKAIVSSGYSNDPVVANYKDYGFSGFINKPYRIKELSALLKKVL